MLHDEFAHGCAIPPKPRGSLPERFPSYSARTAQAVCEERKREHGPRGKVTTVINQHLTHTIRELRMSPETAAYHLSKEHGIDIGFKTIYNHIHAGRLTVTDDNLLLTWADGFIKFLIEALAADATAYTNDPTDGPEERKHRERLRAELTFTLALDPLLTEEPLEETT